ncbi:chemotaxis protein CheW [Thermomonas sp. S9]|nr:chemotaxis protein CheW [Thermomonas sp. S9]
MPVRPARLLRSPFLALADYEQRSLAHVAGLPEQLDAPGLWRGVAYRVGRHRLASGFGEVVEILPLPALTHVPGALPWLLGIANIRGSLLPVVDLKQFLEGERTVLHERQRVLVVRQPGGDVAVTIDELYGQRSFIEAQAIDASALMDGRYAHFVERAYRMNDQDWGVFSLERLSRTPRIPPNRRLNGGQQASRGRTMSSLMDSAAGKGRNLSTNFWIWLLVGSLVVFAGNTLYATTKASRLGGASTAASRLQLNSQRLANQAREAIDGNAQAFEAFKATKSEVDADVK